MCFMLLMEGGFGQNRLVRGLSAVVMWCSACMQRDMPIITSNAIPILTDESGHLKGPFIRPKLVHCSPAEGCSRHDKECHPHFDR